MVSSHGRINCDYFEKYKVTTIPDGIELIKISIAASGVINCFTQETISRYLVEINKSISGLLNENFDENMLNNLVGRIRRSVIKKCIPVSTEIAEKKRKREEHDTDYRLHYEHVQCFDEGFKIYKLGPGDKIANKIYSRKFGEKKKNDFSIIEIEDPINIVKLTDTMYNIPQLHDLFSDFYPEQTYDVDYKQTISLEQILHYYKREGVTRLILFDFSCSLFFDEYEFTKFGNDLRRVQKLNKDVPNGGKFNKKTLNKKKCHKKKSCKRQNYKMKSRKRQNYKKKSCKRKSCKRKFNKRK